MGIKLNFKNNELTELDFIIFNDIFKLVKKEINNEMNNCKITYNYNHLLSNFTKEHILETFDKIYNTSLLIDGVPEHWIITINEYKTTNEVMLHIINLNNLKENFYVDRLIKED